MSMEILINGDLFALQANIVGVFASDGTVIYPDSLAQSYAYDAVLRLISTTVTNSVGTYKQTYTYADAKTKNIASTTQWVKQ